MTLGSRFRVHNDDNKEKKTTLNLISCNLSMSILFRLFSLKRFALYFFLTDMSYAISYKSYESQFTMILVIYDVDRVSHGQIT